MKFSWKWLNQLVKINDINLDEIMEQLTLAGFELDGIDHIQKNNDTIIDISITPNRSDVSSIIGLAKEINTIFNVPLIKQLSCNYLCHTNIQNKLQPQNKYLKYINFAQFNNLYNNQSPKWMQNYLISYGIKPKYLTEDIIQYIKLKWNYNIYICTLDQIIDKQQELDLNIDYSTYNTLDQLTNKNLIIYSFVKKNHNITSSYIEFQEAYNETINLIQTYGKATIGKLYQYYNHEIKTYNNIRINKNKINNILGPITNSKQQYLSTLTIIQLLQQLKLKPIYHKQNKTFEVIIPEHRLDDLTRDIDIIEEISRTYGFHKFYDQLLNIKNYQKGSIQVSRKYTFHIRQILRDLGLHETLNSSFTDYSNLNNYNTLKHNISLYNPMNEYNKLLRVNIIDNLIQNYINNYKQKNTKCEFFEIGKIFNKHLSNLKPIEHTHLGLTFNNDTFTRISWSDKPISMNWFHAKGLIEEFLHKLNAQVVWKTYQENTIDYTIFPYNQLYLFNKLKTGFLYDPIQNITIGIFGQINRTILKHLDYETSANTNIYGFEVNLIKLINTIKHKRHIEYRYKTYSLYPNITRDISFNLANKQTIDNVIDNIQNINIEIIESIQVFNEYYNNVNKTRSIGLRIIYRSKYRTLKTEEIEKTHLKITKLLQNI